MGQKPIPYTCATVCDWFVVTSSSECVWFWKILIDVDLSIGDFFFFQNEMDLNGECEMRKPANSMSGKWSMHANAPTSKSCREGENNRKETYA